MWGVAPRHSKCGTTKTCGAGGAAALAASPQAQQAQPADYPLVVSSDALRPIRALRSLYESVLRLEQQGVVLVERRLSLVDLVLSPSAALVVYDAARLGHSVRGRCAAVAQRRRGAA